MTRGLPTSAPARQAFRRPPTRPIARRRAPTKRWLALGLTLLPDAYQLHQTLGRLQATRGDKSAAIKSYEIALKLNPKKTTSEIRNHETTTAALAALR